MKIVKIALPVIAAILIIVAVLAPIGPMPGIFIGGTETPAPANWPNTSDVHEIKLKVPGTIPRVVIIWVIQVDGTLYVVGAQDSGWVKMLGEGGPVRMRLGDATYALNASKVNSGWEPVVTAYSAKYVTDYPDIVNSFPSIEDAAGYMAVFRLDK